MIIEFDIFGGMLKVKCETFTFKAGALNIIYNII